MDLISLILAFIGAYGVFLFLAYVLARLFFPSLDVEDTQVKPKRTKERKKFASR